MKNEGIDSLGVATAELNEIFREFIEDQARTGDRIEVQVPLQEARARLEAQPGVMESGIGRTMALSVNPMAILPFVSSIVPSLTQGAFAWLDSRYGDVLRKLLSDNRAAVQPLLSPGQWEEIQGLVDILNPKALNNVVHPRIMSAIKK